MEKYKRFTIKNNDIIDTNCKNCKQCKKVGRKYICNDMTACDEEILNRLAELEDKIENGTLIELPCKVGDWLYYIHENIIHKAKVEEIRFNVYKHGIKNEFTDIYAYDFKNKREISFDYEHGYSTVWENNEHYFFDTFLTKAEAEAKLKG